MWVEPGGVRPESHLGRSVAWRLLAVNRGTADWVVRNGTLRHAPGVHRRYAVHAADRAVRRARLRRGELAPEIVDRIRLERHTRGPALLRAVVHQPALADVQIPSARAAPPVVGLAVGQIVLKVRDSRIEVLENLPRPVD